MREIDSGNNFGGSQEQGLDKTFRDATQCLTKKTSQIKDKILQRQTYKALGLQAATRETLFDECTTQSFDGCITLKFSDTGEIDIYKTTAMKSDRAYADLTLDYASKAKTERQNNINLKVQGILCTQIDIKMLSGTSKVTFLLDN